MQSLYIFAAIATLYFSNHAYGISCFEDVKATTQQDLDALSSCSTIKGSLTIDKSDANQLKLDGVSMVDGDIYVANNDALSHISFPRLQAVNGVFKLENNKALNNLDVKSLNAVRSFEVAVHPALPAITFPAGLNQVDRFSVSDTTATRIEGLQMSKVNDVVVDNNIYLKSINMGNVSEITNSLTVSANSASLTLDLGKLLSVKDASFRNLAGITLDNLNKVGGDISFVSNSFESLEMPNVTEVGGTLTLSNNKQLTRLTVPELRRLGGALSLGNNTQLTEVNAFPHLEEVDGSLDLTGSFEALQLPKLNDVRGGLNVQTTSDRFSCDDINKLKGGVIKGNSFVCKSKVANPKSGINGGKDGSDGDTSGSQRSSQEHMSSTGLALAVIALFVFGF